MHSRRIFSVLRVAAVGLTGISLSGLAANQALADGGSTMVTSALTSHAKQDVAPLYGGQEVTSGEYASPERAQAAIGHYSRAKTLLVEAMREFDQGRQMARPDLVINADVWSSTLNTRAEELNHIISPEARDTEGGVRLNESEAILRQNFDKKPEAAKPATHAKKTTVQKIASATKGSKSVTEKLVAVDKTETNTGRASLTADHPPVFDSKMDTEPAAEADEHSSATVHSLLDHDAEAAPAKQGLTQKDQELEKAVDAEVDKAMGASAGARSSGVKAESAKSDNKGSKKDDSSKYSDEETGVGKPALGDEEIRQRLKKLSEEISQEEKGAK